MKEGEVLVKVENLSKKFCKDLKRSLWYGVQDLNPLKFSSTGSELRKDEFWAVKDVSFELRRGECLGLIGHNGAGKSTLLKMLNGLINPDKGKITIKGRVGALIELGAGFNPILSGRENIYNNGAVLGFSKQEIDAKVEEIIDFAEIREFIDMPVQNYSSGMRVRLGFAIASQMEPDVLIIDEVLAVGDTSFRAKCFNRMSELSKTSSMIFVSHSMPLIGRICDSAILIKNGEIICNGNTGDVIYNYLKNQKSGIINVAGELKLDKMDFICDSNKLNYMEDLSFTINFKMPLSVGKFIIHYSVLDQEMKTIYQAFSIEKGKIFINMGKLFQIKIVIKNIDLTNGKYFINIGFIENNFKGKNLCRYDSIFEFEVVGSKYNAFSSVVKDTLWIQN